MIGDVFMTKINIVFDDALNDVDIIAVPDNVAPKVEEICQEFLLWDAPDNDSDYWMVVGDRKYSVAETNGFIKWLNLYHCSESEKAFIVKEKTTYCPQYKTIYF